MKNKYIVFLLIFSHETFAAFWSLRTQQSEGKVLSIKCVIFLISEASMVLVTNIEKKLHHSLSNRL